MVRQLVNLPGRGISLEVDIHCSDPVHDAPSDSGRGLVLLVLHPWAWLGGCMDDHVVAAMCRAALATGRFAAVVRYNMRGTGASGGTRALHPSVDAADLVQLSERLMMELRKLHHEQVRQQEGQEQQRTQQQPQQENQEPQQRQQEAQRLGEHHYQHYQHDRPPESRTKAAVDAGCGPPGPPPAAPLGDADAMPQPQRRGPRLVLVGYSYGGLVAARALPQLRPQLAAVAAVALPLGTLCRIFLGASGSWNELAGPRSAAPDMPRLLCSGDRDQFASVRQLQSAVHQARRDEEHATARKVAKRAAAAAPSKAAKSAAAVGTAATDPGVGTNTFLSATDATGSSSSSLELVLWPGCDHFFFDCQDPQALAAAGLLAPPNYSSDSKYTRRIADDDVAGSSAIPNAGGVAVTAVTGTVAGAVSELQPWLNVEPWKALASFVVGWLLSRVAGPPPP